MEKGESQLSSSRDDSPPTKKIKLYDKPRSDGDNHEGGNELAVTSGAEGRATEDGRFQVDLLIKIPPELWEMIFTNLEPSPNDFQVVINCCKKWRQLLSSRLTSVLFPSILPYLAPYLPAESLLKCREACKNWKRAIDTQLENHPVSVDSFVSHWWHSDSPFAEVNKLLDRHYSLDNPGVADFMEKLKHKSPIISRSVSIRLGGANNFEPDYEACMKFLGKFGDQIWDFNSFCPALESAEGIAVRKVSGMLTVLPKLRSLKIDWNTNTLSRVPREVLEELRRDEPPLPPLEHLRTLNFDFRGGGILERVMGRALLRSYGNQLTTLVCRGELFEMDYINPATVSDLLPNLKNLRIFSVTDPVLRKLSLITNLPLQRLHLWYSFQSLQFGNLIRAINPFSQSLVQLHMDIKLEFPHMFGNDNEENMVNPEQMSIKFPELKVLSAPMSCVNSNWFWDMMKFKFRELERIDLQTAMESLFAPYQQKYLKRELNQSKRFFNFLKNLYMISVWFHNEGNIVLRRPK